MANEDFWPAPDFEKCLEEELGEEMRKSDQLCQEVWSALANIKWWKNGIELSYTFRQAGGLIAEISKKGDYLTWYCSGPYEIVTPTIQEAMAKHGWTWSRYDD